MTEFVVEPLPGVILSDEDMQGLPLLSFHLGVIVEPDPESYLLIPGDSEFFGPYLHDKFIEFEKELDLDSPIASHPLFQQDRDSTEFVWLKYQDESVNVFTKFANHAFTTVQFLLFNGKDSESFGYYLKGIYADHPDWRVAIIGASFEDEVIYFANCVQNMGFSTTVLTRYCMSKQAFIDIDKYIDYQTWLRHAGHDESTPYTSPLDDWLREQGIDLNDDEDDADENNDGE